MSEDGLDKLPRTSYLVARLDRLIRSQLSDVLQPFGLSVPQYTLLSILERRPGLSNAQLARRSYITAQAMHQVVNARTGLDRQAGVADHSRIQLTELTDGVRPSSNLRRGGDPSRERIFGGSGEGRGTAPRAAQARWDRLPGYLGPCGMRNPGLARLISTEEVAPPKPSPRLRESSHRIG